MPDSIKESLNKLLELEELEKETVEAFCEAVTRVLHECSETLIVMRQLFPKIKKKS